MSQGLYNTVKSPTLRNLLIGVLKLNMHPITPLFFLALPALTSTRVVNDPTLFSSASEMTQLERSPIASNTLQDTAKTRPLAANILTEVAPEEPQILKDRSALKPLSQSESNGREQESAFGDTALMTKAEPMRQLAPREKAAFSERDVTITPKDVGLPSPDPAAMAMQCQSLDNQYRIYMIVEAQYQQFASTQTGGAYVFLDSVKSFENFFRCQEPSSKCRGLVDDLMVLLRKVARHISEIVEKQPNRNRLGHNLQIQDQVALGASDVQNSIERLEALLGCPKRPDT